MPDTQQFEFDVFISYSSKDQAWVRGELLTRIEQAGVTVFILIAFIGAVLFILKNRGKDDTAKNQPPNYLSPTPVTPRTTPTPDGGKPATPSPPGKPPSPRCSDGRRSSAKSA